MSYIAMRPSSLSGGTSLRACPAESCPTEACALETIGLATSARWFCASRAGSDAKSLVTSRATPGMADLNLSSKDAGQSSVEAVDFSDAAARSSEAAGRSSEDPFRHAEADVSAGIST